MFRPSAKKFALVAAGTLLGLLLGEAVVRGLSLAPPVKVMDLAAPECVYRRSKNPLLGFELKADFRHDAPDFIQNFERTNSLGLRDRERNPERSGKRRVLLLGDSVVEGYGLRETETISARWEAVAGADYEVLNFGTSAYCTLAEIELLETKGLALQPDIVVLVFVENDFDNFNREAFPLGGTLARPQWAESLFSASELFRLTCLQLNLFHFRADSTPAEWNERAIGENNVSQGLARLRQLADTHEFEAFVAIWPRFEDVAVTDVHFLPDSEELVVEAVAKQYGLPTFRLSQAFSAASGTSPRLAFSQGDGLHPSPAGAQVAAAALHAVVQRGVDQLPQGHSTAASTEVEQALAQLGKATANYARVFDRLGNAAFKRGDFTAAQQHYERALQEDAEDAAVHHNLALTLEQLNAPSERVIEHLRQAIALYPEFAEAHYHWGNVLAKQEPSSGQEHWIRAVELKPDFVPAHYALSRSLLAAGRPTAGIAGLRQVIALAPDHTAALNRLAEELAKQGNLEEASDLFARVTQIDSEHADAWNNLGVLRAQNGDGPSAIAAFEAAVRANPEHPRAAKNLAALRSSTNKPKTD